MASRGVRVKLGPVICGSKLSNAIASPFAMLMNPMDSAIRDAIGPGIE